MTYNDSNKEKDKENSITGLKTGDTAPDFELMDTNQEYHKLSNYNKGNTILAFFPAAFSSVCTREMCNFRDSMESLKSFNTGLIGISVDSPSTNKAFVEEHKLNFTVLSDYDKKVIEKYDIVMLNLEKKKVAKRSIFILDDKLKIKYRWVSDNPLLEPNYDEIRKAVS